MILNTNSISKIKPRNKSKSVLYSSKKNIKNFFDTKDNKLNKTKIVKSKSSIKILNYHHFEILKSNKKNVFYKFINPLNFISKKNI